MESGRAKSADSYELRGVGYGLCGVGYALGAWCGEFEGRGDVFAHLGGSTPYGGMDGWLAAGGMLMPHGSCVAAPMSSGIGSLRLLILLARALLNIPSGTWTSPTRGIASIVPRLSSVVWLKYAASGPS